MTTVTLTFLGAAGTVTGSKYLLTLGARRVLVDAGMYQGEKVWRDRNWEDFPVDPASITDLVLTHAHADHSTYIPALVKAGFRGPIWATEGTIKLAEIVLRDAGKLQEQAAMEANDGGYAHHTPALPLYTLADVEAALPLMREVAFDTDVDLGQGLVARYTRAGHILGSASVNLSFEDATMLFSGDIGRHDHPLLRGRGTPRGAEYVLVESTYGDREHPEPAVAHEQFADAIRRTVARGGKVLIPAFAIDRIEVVLKALHDMYQAKRIPECPVIVDGPMALSALDVYSDVSLNELRDDVTVADFRGLPDLREARTPQQSKRLAALQGPAIIISSSGMAEGGRILNHLLRGLPDERNTVVLVGYQAEGTRGRQLVDGARGIKINGRYVKVRAEIVRDDEFSVHGDASDLLDWLRGLDREPECVFVVHGEPQVAEHFAQRIHEELGWLAVVARYNEVVRLDPSGPQVEVEGEAPVTDGPAQPDGE